jgi:hypothetical protein
MFPDVFVFNPFNLVATLLFRPWSGAEIARKLQRIMSCDATHRALSSDFAVVQEQSWLKH